LLLAFQFAVVDLWLVFVRVACRTNAQRFGRIGVDELARLADLLHLAGCVAVSLAVLVRVCSTSAARALGGLSVGRDELRLTAVCLSDAFGYSVVGLVHVRIAVAISALQIPRKRTCIADGRPFCTRLLIGALLLVFGDGKG
jgi:hypothetical protein